MQLGKMYLVKEYCWLLFPTKEVAWGCGGRPSTMANAKFMNQYYQAVYNCSIPIIESNTYAVLLEVDENEYCYKLLDYNGNIGWICASSFSKYFEVVKE